jgi:hypothetical protein
MPGFHEHIIADLLEDGSGGLVVTGSGLGLHKLIAALSKLHDLTQGILFILSASDFQRQTIKENFNPDPSKRWK